MRIPSIICVLPLAALLAITSCVNVGQRLLHFEVESGEGIAFTGFRGVPDNTPVDKMWDVLDDLPLDVSDEVADSISSDELAHTISESVTIRIKHVDNVLGELSLSSLTLTRPDGSAAWQLADEDVNRIQSQLANPTGDVRGQTGDVLRAEQESTPVRMVVQANNDFAWTLYGRLLVESHDQNLFFSPYSISTALAMAAEGARGQTALEMGEVLGYPDVARLIGEDAQLIPWRMTLLNSGMAQLQERLDARDDESTRDIRERIATLRADLATMNERAVARDQQNDFNGAFAAQREAQALAHEINELLTQVEQYELSVASAIWGDRSFPFDEAYVETINDTFQTGGVFNVDFADDPEGTRGEINSWIAEQDRWPDT